MKGVVIETYGITVNMNIGSEEIEPVSIFKYMGSFKNEDVKCEREIKTKIVTLKEEFSEKNEYLASESRGKH